MPPLVDDIVVSPELALVDPELAARAREALPDLALRRLAAAAAHEIAPAPSASRGWRDRVPTTPGLTLLATAAASLVVTAITGHESARGEGPIFEVVQEAELPPAAGNGSVETTNDQPLTGSAVTGGRPSSAVTAVSTGGTAAVPASGARRPASTSSGPRHSSFRAPHASATTLVWPGSPQATYDVELVRGDVIILSSRTAASHVVVRRRWQRSGVSYSIRPEDQAFVWPVVNGRRAAAPIVDGVLALDMTPVSRFVDLSRGTSRS